VKAIGLSEMMQNNSRYSVQGHWRSIIYVPVQSLYAIFSGWIIQNLSPFPRCCLQSIGQIFAVNRGCLPL